MSSSGGAIDDWLRGELHEVVGYYDKTLAQFLLSLAQKAPGPQALHTQLLGSGVDDGPKVRPFAEQLFRRVRGGGGRGGGGRKAAAPGGMGQQQPTNAELIRQSQQYGMVESDDEEFALALGGGGGGGGKKKVCIWVGL